MEWTLRLYLFLVVVIICGEIFLSESKELFHFMWRRDPPCNVWWPCAEGEVWECCPNSVDFPFVGK